MSLPNTMRKPKRIVWVSGAGDSSKLNTNPWQNKDVQYRYEVERNSYDSGGYTRGAVEEFSEILSRKDIVMTQGYLNKLKEIEASFNKTAIESLQYEPVLRGLARYGYPITSDRELDVVRIDINPVLQYERFLIETCRLWEVASNKSVFLCHFGNDFNSGVGLKHESTFFMKLKNRSSTINANRYLSDHYTLMSVQDWLGKILGSLASTVWTKLDKNEKNAFALSFIDAVHFNSKSYVEAGVFNNIIDDYIVANDHDMCKAGLLLHNCYIFGEREGLVPTVPMPRYDLSKAEIELKERHENITVPYLSGYVSKHLTQNFSSAEAIAFFSEISEHLAEVQVYENRAMVAQELVEANVMLLNEVERCAILLSSMFYAIQNTCDDVPRLNQLTKPAKDKLLEYKDKNGKDFVAKMQNVLGEGYCFLADELQRVLDS